MNKLALIAALVVTPAVGLALSYSPVQAKIAPRPAAQPESAVEGMPPMPPPPGEHHQWLDQFVGTWTTESKMVAQGAPPMQCTGTDSVRSIGGRWIVCELNNHIEGVGEMHAVLTLGYNPETGKYQATWIDSMTDHLWVYDGTLDADRKVLTLEAEGPNMMDPDGGTALYRDVIEFKSPDHRTQNSYAQVNGQWVHFATSNYHRAD